MGGFVVFFMCVYQAPLLFCGNITPLASSAEAGGLSPWFRLASQSFISSH